VNPIQILLDAVAWVLGLLSGIGLNPDRLAVTALFFGVGWLYGKLTRNIGFWKLIFLVYFGAYLLAMLANADPLIVWGFILGILANHSYLYARVFSWARNLGDVFFALRYRRAFEDIRRREQELEERERQFQALARAQARAQGESAQQKQWKEQAQARRGQQSGTSSGSTGTRQEHTSQPNSSGSSTRDGLKAQYLRTMGLDPQKSHSKDDLKRAYRRRAKETHPDLGGSSDAFRDVSSAYEWLAGQA
jgi:hypothetical protein